MKAAYRKFDYYELIHRHLIHHLYESLNQYIHKRMAAHFYFKWIESRDLRLLKRPEVVLYKIEHDSCCPGIELTEKEEKVFDKTASKLANHKYRVFYYIQEIQNEVQIFQNSYETCFTT